MEKVIIAEGKTKIIYQSQEPGCGEFHSKDDITAGDGAKHDVLPGKGAWATTTTCNVFRLLRDCGIPVAFREQISDTVFLAELCDMFHLEVVVRRESHGSCLNRNPNLRKGNIFPRLVVELFLKTSGKKWLSTSLPCDDPLIVFQDKLVHLYDPHKPVWSQQPILSFSRDSFMTQVATDEDLDSIKTYAIKTFLAIEKAWQILGQRLVDFKVEFGRTKDGQILLTDVVDSDSWRKIGKTGGYEDKQLYRDGHPLAEVAKKYQEAAELTSRFGIPNQQVILWRGSEKDDLTAFRAALNMPLHSSVHVEEITCSAHKQPVRTFTLLNSAIQRINDSVIIADIGMSNAAGPILAANCTCPVITVPATAKEFPDDIWSSLRMPSSVPLMTVVSPDNAVLAALQILASRNPALYANLRYEQEKRMPDGAC